MNSNTTDRGRSNRGPRSRSSGGRSPRGPHKHPLTNGVRSRPSTAPSLEAFACDTTPVPFTSLGLDKRLLEGIRDLGFKDTRPVQTAVIPLALAGDDIIACAETGTGKTAAFVVPTLQWLLTTGARAVPPPRQTPADSQPDGDASPEEPAVPGKSRVLVYNILSNRIRLGLI